MHNKYTVDPASMIPLHVMPDCSNIPQAECCIAGTDNAIYVDRQVENLQQHSTENALLQTLYLAMICQQHMYAKMQRQLQHNKKVVVSRDNTYLSSVEVLAKGLHPGSGLCRL